MNREDDVALDVNTESLLPQPLIDQDELDLHIICKRIKEAKNDQPSSAQTDAVSVINIAEPLESDGPSCFENTLSYFKTGTGYVLLGGRTLSCLYRFVLVNESIRLLFKIPGLNQWQDASGVIIAADVIGAMLALADMIQTIIASKKSVLELCEHPNWMGGIKEFFQNIFENKYPKDLLLSGLMVCFASGMKGVVGSQNVLHRVTQFQHMENVEKLTPLTYLIGISSSICFLAFQWLGQGMWVDRAFKSLKQDDHYSNYLSRHKGWDRGTTAIGVSLGVVGALVGALAACYVNHEFEFNNPFHITLFFIALTAAYFNLFYSYNLITRMEWLLKLHNTESCPACLNDPINNVVPAVIETQPVEAKSTCFNHFAKGCSSFFGSSVSNLAALGGSITFSPAIIRTLQIILHLIGIASSNEEHYSVIAEDPRVILTGLLISIPFVYFSTLQYTAVWGESAAATSKKATKNPAEQNGNLIINRDSTVSTPALIDLKTA